MFVGYMIATRCFFIFQVFIAFLILFLEGFLILRNCPLKILGRRYSVMVYASVVFCYNIIYFEFSEILYFY